MPCAVIRSGKARLHQHRRDLRRWHGGAHGEPGCLSTYIKHGADRIVTVSDDEIAEAVRLYFRCCHTIAEGAGAAPLAALMQERDRMKGKRVGVILSGGNIDMPKFAAILRGETPRD